MTEVRRYAPYVPCPTCTANRPRLCDLHYQQRAEAFLQAVKRAIADPRTPDGVKATYEELLAQNRALAARVQAVEQEIASQDVQMNAVRYRAEQAEQQVARLRESSNDLVEFFTQNHEDVGEELYGRVNGKDLTPSAKRLNEMLTEMQQALRETGA